MKKNITLTALVLLLSISTHATHCDTDFTPMPDRSAFDYFLSAVDYAYHAQFNEYVQSIDYVLGCIVNETTPFSHLFSSLHVQQFVEMRYLLLTIRHEWPAYVTNYTYTYGCPLSIMINVHAALNNTSSALYYAKPRSWILYDRELDSILDYLDNVLYEISHPIPHVNSLGYMERCFSAITHIINGIR